MKNPPSKKTQQDMFEFFMKTSAPRLLMEHREAEKQKEGEKT